MEELKMIDRKHDVWFKSGDADRYIIGIMYSPGDGLQPRFVTSNPMMKDSVLTKLEPILNDCEQGRMVCLNAHFINPKNIITVKVALYNESKVNGRREDYDGEYYL